jgi:hypothetical protein
MENKSGRLTEITRLIGEANINISAFSIADSSDYGILRMIVTEPDKAVAVLRDNGFSVSITEVICLIVPHTPGGLFRALKILSDNNVSIDYMYAFAMETEATVVIRTGAPQQAIDVLQRHEMQLVSASQIYRL